MQPKDLLYRLKGVILRLRSMQPKDLLYRLKGVILRLQFLQPKDLFLSSSEILRTQRSPTRESFASEAPLRDHRRSRF
jgi:hypothetical protein